MTAPWTQWQQWELVEKIGQGSYGAVYKAAKNTADGEALSAIKVISIPPSEAEVYSIKAEGYNAEQAKVYFKTIAEDYINECRVMQSLKESANVVAIEDYYMSEKTDGIGFDIFMRMELLTPLTTYLEENAVDEMMVAKLGSDICAALDTCAGHNIIHRDIKPDNIFLDAQGNFKLGDFGIARRMDSLSGNLTKIGTENYMAPEIFMGGQYDSRVDLYSLGLVMYALLNNRKLPFWPKDKQIISARERHEAFSRRMSGEKLPIPEKCSAKMAETILKACSLKPENRFASAAEMKEKLHRISDPVPVKKKEPKRSNRWRAPLIACIILLLFGLLIGGIAAFVGNNTTPTSPAFETPDEPSAGDIDLPVTPTMPNEPSTPDDPSQPIMPNEPSPSELNTPTTPTEPDEPEVPTEPTEPTEPTPHTHIWDNGEVTLAATCKDEGVRTFTCSCDETKTEAIAKLSEHQYDNGIIDGTVKTYTCTVCGDIKTETVQSPEPTTPTTPIEPNEPEPNEPEPTVPSTPDEPVTPDTPDEPVTPDTPDEPVTPDTPDEPTPHTHSWGNGIITLAATCKDAGVMTYTCSDCGDTKTETIAKLTTHTYGNGSITQAATCKDAGVKIYTCSVCGDTKTESIAKLTTHTYNNGTVSGNIKTYTCTVCGATKTETVENSQPTASDITKYLTYTVTDGKATITDVDTSISGDITIPATLGGYPVTSIGNSAFDGCTSLTRVTIPESVTSIGVRAFVSCRDLTSIIIPYGITSIGNSAFDSCSSLTNVTIPDSVTNIGNNAFAYCSKLTNIEIPDSVTSIDDRAFYYCRGLTSVVIPKSVISIGSEAFNGCTRLTSITVDDSNSAYKSVDDVLYTKDEKTLIQYSVGKTDASFVIPDNVTSIGNSAFEECGSLTSVIIGNGVETIGSSAFYGCSGLTSITIPDSVTSIGSWAFRNCSSLTSIIISDSVTTIGSYAFYGCSKLTIYCEATYAPAGWSSTYNQDNCPVIWGYGASEEPSQPDTSMYTYTVTDGAATITDVDTAISGDITIPSTLGGYPVTSIGNGAFVYCKDITSIKIPDSVTSIGYSAFESCSNLTSINIPYGVTTIESHLFHYCSNLSSISIPNSVTTISKSAFECCFNLTSITIPASVTRIDESVFYCCDNLASVYITDIAAWCSASYDNSGNPLAYGADLYLNGTLVTELVIPESVTSIGAYAFYGYTKLTSVTIPDSVTSIGVAAFEGCSGLTSVIIPSSVTSIGAYAFIGWSGLTIYCEAASQPAGWSEYWKRDDYPVVWGYSASSEPDTSMYTYSVSNGAATITKVDTSISGNVIIPSTLGGAPVTCIGYEAFRKCNQMTSIDIPDTVKIIDGLAFSECDSLTSITIPDSVTSIGLYAFNYCTGLSQITLGSGLSTVGSAAFWECQNLKDVYIDSMELWFSISFEDSAAIPLCYDANLYFGGKLVTDVTIPGNITHVPDHAFYCCISLQSVTVSEGVETIGDFAFFSCDNLSSVTLPDSLTSIGERVFAHCKQIGEIIIPLNVISMGSNVFLNCESLTISCEASSQPNGWNKYWNSSNCPVVWKEESLI